MTQHKIDTWTDYLNLTLSPQFVSWAFRGQSDSNWSIQSTLSRYLEDFRVHKDCWELQEERIIRIFKRKAHHYLKNIPDDDDIVQWLSIMQHHGAPTRLVDFTWSPFVAAFFALHRTTKESAVWAIYPAGFDYKPSIDLIDGNRIDPKGLYPNTSKQFKDNFLQGKVPFVVTGEPKAMNDRLIAQSGTFAIPSVLDQPIENIMNNYMNSSEIVVKFILNSDKIRDEAMSYFHVTNINESTLFPGIDGMARSLAYELEYHWAYNPKNMIMNKDFETPPYGLPTKIIK
ncbi:MAG: FRG domain-containing protein [Bacteroidia bacterium]